MNLNIFAEITVTKPVVIGISVAALVGLCLAFKFGKFIFKTLLWLVALAAIGLAAWWYYTAHHVPQ